MGYQNFDFECRSCYREFTKEIHYNSPNGDCLDLETEEIECPHCGQKYKVMNAYVEVDILETNLYEEMKYDEILGGMY